MRIIQVKRAQYNQLSVCTVIFILMVGSPKWWVYNILPPQLLFNKRQLRHVEVYVYLELGYTRARDLARYFPDPNYS